MRRFAIVTAPFLLVTLIVLLRLRGPAPEPANAPEREFSAARAMSVLRELLPENVPHPVGTPENARVRDRIVQRFRAHGYETTIQRRFACNAHATCATVENILARLPNANAARETVAVVAHYDSVPAGPGASDDGVGVAALLETARAVRGEEFRNSVLFLITDGEEAGLLGAEGFVADEALSKDVAVVINIEHRGTGGASFLFETSQKNAALIRALRSRLELPIATSLFFTIYDLLPNDTDVTIFKRAGKEAINFGAIGNPLHYHTANDDLAHVSPRTLQHGGDNVLASLRALANRDLAARSDGNAVYFDILGFVLIAWPAGFTIVLAIVSFLVLLIGARTSPARAITMGVLAAFATVGVAAMVGFALGWLAQVRHEQAWVARPALAIAAMWLVGVASAMLVARKDARPTLIGYAIVWHVIAIALAIFLPGPSYLFLVPAMAASLCVIARANDATIGLVAGTLAAALFFPFAAMLYTALGGPALMPTAVLVALGTMFAAPLVASRRAAIVTFAAAVVLTLASLALPPYTKDAARGLSLVYYDDASLPRPLWLTNAVTDEIHSVMQFTETELPIPWSRNRSRMTAPAPQLGLPRVQLTREGNTLRVRSQRDARRVTLAFRSTAPVRGLRVNGVAPPPKPPRFRDNTAEGWQIVLVHGPAMDVAIDTAPNAKIEAVATDFTYGLPAESAVLVRARAKSAAMPVHDGDLTMTRVRL